MVKSVGIVGYGHFGALLETLTKRFAPQASVLIYRHGDSKSQLQEVAKCDVVFLAVPIHAFEEVLGEVVPLLGEKSVLVDVATVKVHTTALLKKLAKGKRYLATHPVWGPESYEKRGGDIKGLRIVMVDGTLSIDEYNAVMKFLKECGFKIVEMSAEEHDRYIAETLFLTHFIAQIVTRAGMKKRTAMDTVSFGWLMNAVESVEHDQELFKDVYKYNPYCKEVLERIGIGEAEVQKLLA